MEQIDLFEMNADEDGSAEQIIFEIGENIKIRKLTEDAVNLLEPEDYYYLKEFENKRGTSWNAK